MSGLYETRHNEFCIRQARAHELARLPEIERRAAVRFQQVADRVDAPMDLSPLEELEAAYRAGRVWVVEAARDELAGFAYATVLDDYCHLEEIDILPELGRRGLGASLVREVIEHARQAGLSGVTLFTYRDVPWNAPFYQRLGFEELTANDLTPELAEAFADESRRGLDPSQRLVMIHRC